LQRLEEIALVQALRGVSMMLGHAQKLIRGKERRLARAHVGKNVARDFATGIRTLADALVERAARRLARLLQTATTHIVEPPMVDAAQTTVFDSPVAEVRTSMRAVNSQ